MVVSKCLLAQWQHRLLQFLSCLQLPKCLICGCKIAHGPQGIWMLQPNHLPTYR
ncbi:hypothetical protein BT96DRAFT_915017, partial [Gymnopus androsaceus JB14]